MACHDTWLENNTGLIKTFSDEVPITEVLMENNALFFHRDFNTLNYIIYDFSHMTNGTFDTKHTGAIAKVAQVRANTKEYLKVALIARDSTESMMAANAFCKQMIGCHYQCAVFKTVDDANTWVTNS